MSRDYVTTGGLLGCHTGQRILWRFQRSWKASLLSTTSQGMKGEPGALALVLRPWSYGPGPTALKSLPISIVFGCFQ